MRKEKLGKRVAMSLFGVIICAISVGIFKIAALGVDPFQSFMAGLDSIVPISFGTLYVITNAVMLLFALIFDRHYIGIYITQFTYEFLQKIIVNPNIGVRIACLVIGVVIICFGSAFYMTADLGVSTYDAVALIIVNTWKKGKFKYVRILCDFICVALGVSLFFIGGGRWSSIGAVVGVGTIVTAFFMGPLIAFFRKHIAEPLLYGNGSDKA